MIQNSWKKTTVTRVEPKPIPNIAFHKKEQRWNTFCKEYIFIDNGVCNMLPRQHAIRAFVEDGLDPYILDKGYIWNKHIDDITKSLLHIMFEMWLGNTVHIPNLQKRYSIEHYERFIVILGAEEWDFFWNKWSSLQDFSDSGYAYRMRFLMANFVWNTIDLENSAVTQEVEKEIEELEFVQDSFRKGTDISKGKDDPYLQDIQQNGGTRDKHNY